MVLECLRLQPRAVLALAYLYNNDPLACHQASEWMRSTDYPVGVDRASIHGSAKRGHGRSSRRSDIAGPGGRVIKNVLEQGS